MPVDEIVLLKHQLVISTILDNDKNTSGLGLRYIKYSNIRLLLHTQTFDSYYILYTMNPKPILTNEEIYNNPLYSEHEQNQHLPAGKGRAVVFINKY